MVAPPSWRRVLARQGGSGYNLRVIAKDLLDVLICPACRSERDQQISLAYDEARQVLTCSGCHRVYPIRDGIPVLLIDEATIEKT